jgi:hypothetical protein
LFACKLCGLFFTKLRVWQAEFEYRFIVRTSGRDALVDIADTVLPHASQWVN